MAAMQLTRTVFFGISKAFPKSQAPRTLAVAIGRKSSRVFFASSVNHSKVINIWSSIQIDA